MKVGDIEYIVSRDASLGPDRGVWITVVRKQCISTPSLIRPTTVVSDDMWEVLVKEPSWFDKVRGISLEDRVGAYEKHANKVVRKLVRSDNDILNAVRRK